MSTTASALARGFGIVLRQVCQLFNTITELYTSGLLHNMNITYQEANQLHVRVHVLARVNFKTPLSCVVSFLFSRCTWNHG